MVIFFLIKFTFIQNVSSQSHKTGTAPSSVIAPTVATKVFAAVITSSPSLIPITLRDNFNASVPEFTPTAYLVPIKFENFFQKFLMVYLK